ncbi:MAG TPA: hypothetical protein VG839_06775 [Asticcacaulis sp.]|nr:hypothetical protein [Asticcacaulis sp.]
MPKFIPAAVAALLAFSLAGNAIAQTQQAQTPTQSDAAASAAAAPSDQPSTEDILTASIGCLATYDMVLAKGVTPKTEKTKAARQMAYNLYKQYSGKSDADVQADVKRADEIFPGMVAQGPTKLEEFEATCDNAFMDAPAK